MKDRYQGERALNRRSAASLPERSCHRDEGRPDPAKPLAMGAERAARVFKAMC